MISTKLDTTDNFCGAGGTGQGVRSAGVEVRTALNHWKLATDTYSQNFDNTNVYCADVSAADPRYFPRTTMMHASPECTTHSPAGGNHYKSFKKQMDMFAKGEIDPTTERSRMTMWDVVRFTEYHKYEIVIVENVVEAKTRWPLFDSWLQAMSILGYNNKCLFLNSMHFHPTPQSRDRMYVVFWKKGNKTPDLDYKPNAHCSSCNKDVRAIQWWKNSQKPYGKYKTQYLYRCPECTEVVDPYYHAAFNIIDWTIPGKPVIGREKPLSDNTINRIIHGLKKFGNEYIVIGCRYKYGFEQRVKSQFEPINTQSTHVSHGIVSPFVLGHRYSKELNTNVKSATEVLPTQTSTHQHGIVSPFMLSLDHAKSKPDNMVRSGSDSSRAITTSDSNGLVMPKPFIVELNRTGKARDTNKPISTVLAGGNHHALVQAPFTVINNGQSKSRSITDPIPTQSTEPKHGIVTTEAIKAFITYYYGNMTNPTGMEDALGTCTTRDRHSLVSYKEPKLEDCLYRTLRPHEIHKAMAFEDDYLVLGNSREKVKQLGNAVTPPVAEWITKQCAESLDIKN